METVRESKKLVNSLQNKITSELSPLIGLTVAADIAVRVEKGLAVINTEINNPFTALRQLRDEIQAVTERLEYEELTSSTVELSVGLTAFLNPYTTAENSTTLVEKAIIKILTMMQPVEFHLSIKDRIAIASFLETELNALPILKKSLVSFDFNKRFQKIYAAFESRVSEKYVNIDNYLEKTVQTHTSPAVLQKIELLGADVSKLESNLIDAASNVIQQLKLKYNEHLKTAYQQFLINRSDKVLKLELDNPLLGKKTPEAMQFIEEVIKQTINEAVQGLLNNQPKELVAALELDELRKDIQDKLFFDRFQYLQQLDFEPKSESALSLALQKQHDSYLREIANGSISFVDISFLFKLMIEHGQVDRFLLRMNQCSLKTLEYVEKAINTLECFEAFESKEITAFLKTELRIRIADLSLSSYLGLTSQCTVKSPHVVNFWYGADESKSPSAHISPMKNSVRFWSDPEALSSEEPTVSLAESSLLRCPSLRMDRK